MSTSKPDPADIASLRGHIIDEIMAALGRPAQSNARRLATPLVWLPSDRFARLAVGFEDQVGREGIVSACQDLLPRYVKGVQVSGAEGIPAAGPLLLVSNHPGAYDFLSIINQLPRDDLKIITSTVPLLNYLPHFSGHLIPVTREPHQGMAGARQALRQLRDGGALLTFGSGIVDPDPQLLPGAEEALAMWKPSLALLLQKIPQTRLVVTIVSGVLSAGWLRSPLTRLQPEIWRRRKLAEFFQIMQQMILPGSLQLTPHVSFAPPITAAELCPSGDAAALQATIVSRAQALLRDHMERLA